MSLDGIAALGANTVVNGVVNEMYLGSMFDLNVVEPGIYRI